MQIKTSKCQEGWRMMPVCRDAEVQELTLSSEGTITGEKVGGKTTNAR